ncbi:MAG: PAS domain S-box protein [Firmicutes bacterium]|nr:PAS domain S-box protein [Bacillota bacterium]
MQTVPSQNGSKNQNNRSWSKSYRVCHIDDDTDFLHLFKLKFSRYFEVESFDCAEKAISFFENGNYDAVVTDYDMPVFNGLQILEMIKEKDPFVPVIFCTGQGSEELARKVFRMDATDYFTKNLFEPAHKETLANSIIKAVEASRAEIEKLEIEENYRKLLEASGNPVFKVDTNGVFLFLNEIAAYDLGGVPEDFVGKKMSELFPEPFAERQMSDIHKVIETGFPLSVFSETWIRNAVRTYKTNIYPLKNYLGKVTSIIATSIDISEQVKTENELRQREAHFKLLYEDAPMPYQSLDSKGNILGINSAWLKTLGYSKEEVIGKNFAEFLTEDYKTLFPERFEYFKKTGIAHSAVFDMVKKDGGIISAEFEGKISVDAEGNFIRTHCIFKDVTEVRKAEMRFSNIVEEMPFPLVLVNQNGNIEYLNPEFIRTFGYSHNEVRTVEQWFVRAYPDDDYRKMIELNWQKDMGEKSGKSIGNRCFITRTKFNEDKEISYKIVPIENDRICVVFEDITEKKRAESVIKANEEKFRHVLQNMPVMLDAFDDELNIIVWNKECELVTGYTAEEMKNNPDALKLLYPDDKYRTMVIESFKNDKYSVRNQEWELRCKDGSRKTIAWSSISGECPVNGWSSWAVGVDVTERKVNEDGLRARNRELNDFTYRVSHDLKNPLYILKGYLSLINIQPEDFNELYAKADNQMDKLLSLINSLLTLSRAGRVIGEKVSVDLRDFIKRSFAEYYTSGTEAELHLDNEGVQIKVDPDSFAQVIDNLMQNAFRYRDPSKEKLIIEFRAIKTETGTSIVFSDNGIGIESKQMSRIFETGYTTNKKTGNGFGLSIISKIVEAHNGTFYAVSEGAGKGSEFHIDLKD